MGRSWATQTKPPSQWKITEPGLKCWKPYPKAPVEASDTAQPSGMKCFTRLFFSEKKAASSASRYAHDPDGPALDQLQVGVALVIDPGHQCLCFWRSFF